MKSLRAMSTVAACALIALGAGACGDDDSDDDSSRPQRRSFTERDLPRLVIARSEAPGGTEVDSAGPGVLEKEVDSPDDRRRLRRLRTIGMRANYGVEFEPNSENAPFVAAMAIAFEDPSAARAGLDHLLKGELGELAPAKKIDAAGLGESSYGVNGKFEGEFPTASFGLRTGNLVQVVRVSAQDEAATVKKGRALARRLETLAHR